MTETTTADSPSPIEGETRRDFLLLATAGLGAVGTALAAWPFIDSMNPSASVLALSTVEIDLSPIEVGQAITAIWQDKPVFIRRRTEEVIAAARAVPLDDLPDPEEDASRVQKAEWLILVGICTHLGCIPMGQNPGDRRGDYGGWFCPCHGGHYDTSGRVRAGPPPRNLAVPPYQFLDDTTIRIG